MATKKSTTKAKTKTTSKKTAAVRTRAASKTAKATATKKAEAPKVKKPVKEMTLMRLRSLHMMSAGVFVLLAIVAGLVMNSASFQLTVGHLAADTLKSTDSTVFVPATKAVYDVELRWLVIGILLLSAVLPLLYLSKLENRYSEYLRNTRMWPWRWLDLGVTGGLMAATAALLSGVHDIAMLKLLGDLVLAGALFSLIAERQNNTGDKMIWSAFAGSLFSQVVPWLVIAAYAVSTVVYGALRSPWYVYAVYAAVLGGSVLLAWNQYRQYRRTGKSQNYLLVERNYVVVNLLTKMAFAVVLIVGVR